MLSLISLKLSFPPDVYASTSHFFCSSNTISYVIFKIHLEFLVLKESTGLLQVVAIL